MICAFQDARMMEDESIRSYISRIYEIIVGIKPYGGTKEEDDLDKCTKEKRDMFMCNIRASVVSST